MKRYWIVDQDVGFLSPEGIFYRGTFINGKNKSMAEVKHSSKGYYGSTDTGLDRNEKLWVRLDKKDIMFKSDIRDMIILLYIMVYYSVLLKIVASQ